MRVESTVSRLRILFAFLCLYSVSGCGGPSTAPTPTEEDLQQYLQENPDLNSDDRDDDGEMIDAMKAG